MDFLSFIQSDPDFFRAPYPTYHALRKRGPVQLMSDGSVIVSSYRATRALLKNRQALTADWEALLAGWYTRQIGAAGDAEAIGEPLAEWIRSSPAVAMQTHWVALKDPPDHTRLRTLMNKAFTTHMVERLVPRVETIAHACLDEAAARGEMELVEEYAYRIPIDIIACMLGIPEADHVDFMAWSQALLPIIDLVDMTEESLARGNRAAAAFSDYLRRLVAERRKQPREDLLSVLIEAEETGERLSEDELIANCIFLLLAGHETAMSLISSGTLCLLENPEQLALLRERPALMPQAIEEFLRYESPVQLTTRTAGADMEAAGVHIPQG